MLYKLNFYSKKLPFPYTKRKSQPQNRLTHFLLRKEGRKEKEEKGKKRKRTKKAKEKKENKITVFVTLFCKENMYMLLGFSSYSSDIKQVLVFIQYNSANSYHFYF